MSKTLLLASLLCSIQTLSVQAQQWVLSTSNGLSQATNEFLHQDKYGFIWISSTDGLNRFDGRQVQVFRPDAQADAMAGQNIQSPFWETSGGDIWFTTEKGINCYRRHSGKIQSYFVKDGDLFLKDKVYYAFFLEKERYLWLSVDNSLFVFDTKQPQLAAACVVRQTFDAARCAVKCNEYGQVERVYACKWNYGAGFLVYDIGGNRRLLAQRHIDKNGDTYQQVIQVDATSAWLKTAKGLVAVPHDNPLNRRLYPIHEKTKFREVEKINAANNRFLPVCKGGRIWWFDKLEKSFFQLNVKDWNKQVSDDSRIDNAHVFGDGSIWISVRATGIIVWPQKRNFYQAPATADKTFSCTALFEHRKGAICALDNNGYVQSWDGAPLLPRQLSALARPFRDKMGRLWYCSSDGIYQRHSNGKNWDKKYTFSGLGNFMDCALDSSGNLWVATLENLTKVRLQDGHVQRVFSGVAMSVNISPLQDIWLGCGNALYVFRETVDEKFQVVGHLVNTGDVNAIHFDSKRNCAWLATTKGLVKVMADSAQNWQWTIPGAFPPSNAFAIVQDRKGLLWVSSSKGIICFDPDKHSNPYRLFTTEDGLSSTEYNPLASLYDSKGRIWFGGVSGVDFFYPDSVDYRGSAPKTEIVGIKIHDKSWLGDNAVEMLKHLDLSYDQNTFRLELAAMEFLNPGKNQFKFMLQYGDEETYWTDLGTQNFVTFANLRPGNYTFRFVASNSEGLWTEASNARILHFTIHPHWSQTWWFRTLLALFLLAVVSILMAFYYRYRLREQQLINEQKQREAEKQRLELENAAVKAEGERKAAESEMKLLRAQLNPHFLFNSMNSINRYILNNEPEKASEYLGQFAQLTRSILENSQTLTISLADELKMLDRYIALENLRFRQQISWSFELADDVEDELLQVPSMFLQPFTENAILHGLGPKGGGHIDLAISIVEHQLLCVLRDNGVGRQAQRKQGQTADKPRHASIGMRLISERLDAFAALDGRTARVDIVDLKQDSGEPAGTEVRILLPVR